ncbi:3-deoxy-D-manno-octulosonate 8-phosphate phosphatase [Bifidobacterium tissieri]|uniref:3-deoxy-D-manno-octulosonate 8-phosphate phosphatase n=1 Tax=Bifidobacterium tissieri TaxID=1630162 RepID=A0A261FCS8_9BIFI|nr:MULTISPECIES: HAD hydrolase family protein [Bifidobacterium]OZG56942.1 3-deoxy-D-manno-octulosonate 8-phosphate phosphatase [Bifidobacterium tissieri]TPF96912.1 3-deoxy-D-manno-octulosonate 8-phosphate phosphatase [Bifidobacterium sp. UTCIF-39]
MTIRLLVMDVDGTLTDGRICIGPDGEMMKTFNCKDGYGIKHLLPEAGITPMIITGRESRILERRAAELGVTELHQGIHDKLPLLRRLMDERGLTSAEVSYIGDDLNDLEAIRFVGLSGCPADSAQGIIDVVDYVCRRDGGRGAVREFIEHMIRLNQSSEER